MWEVRTRADGCAGFVSLQDCGNLLDGTALLLHGTASRPYHWGRMRPRCSCPCSSEYSATYLRDREVISPRPVLSSMAGQSTGSPRRKRGIPANPRAPAPRYAQRPLTATRASPTLASWSCTFRPNSKQSSRVWRPKLGAPPAKWRSTCWPARWTTTSGSVQKLRRGALPHAKASCSTTMTSLLEWIGAIAADARPLDDRRRRRSRTDLRLHCLGPP
jgi:hypothetical protein